MLKEKEEYVTIVKRAQVSQCDEQDRIEKETVEVEQPIVLGIGNQEMTLVIEESGRSSEEEVVSYVSEALEGKTSSNGSCGYKIDNVVIDLPCMLPCMKKGIDRVLLVEEVKQDESLCVCMQTIS